MSLWIGLETSTRSPSIALHSGEHTRYRELSAERAHAADLLPLLESLLREEGRTPAELHGVVVGTGPGSYTGLRVGIAIALGLARGCEAELVGLPSTEALAFGELTPGDEGCFVSDAHAGALYFARYARTAAGLEVLDAPRVAPPPELSELSAGGLWKGARVFADARSADLLELNARAGAHLVLDRKPRADALLELGLRRFEREGPSDPEQVQPLYLRPFASKPRKR